MSEIEGTKKYLDKIDRQDWREKCIKILEYLEKAYGYSDLPAAKKFHHNYKGGLQTHNCEVIDLSVRINMMVGSPYPNDDVVIAAFLHDLGKAYVYKWKRIVIEENANEVQVVKCPCSEEALVFRLLAKVGLELPLRIISAVEFAHGGWSTQAHDYHIESSSLASIIHSADLLSASFGDVGKESLNFDLKYQGKLKEEK